MFLILKNLLHRKASDGSQPGTRLVHHRPEAQVEPPGTGPHHVPRAEAPLTHHPAWLLQDVLTGSPRERSDAQRRRPAKVCWALLRDRGATWPGRGGLCSRRGLRAHAATALGAATSPVTRAHGLCGVLCGTLLILLLTRTLRGGVACTSGIWGLGRKFPFPFCCWKCPQPAGLVAGAQGGCGVGLWGHVRQSAGWLALTCRAQAWSWD